MVGGDGVDDSVGERAYDGLPVALAAQGRRHLGVRVVGLDGRRILLPEGRDRGGDSRHRLVGQGEVVRGRLGGDAHPARPGLADRPRAPPPAFSGPAGSRSAPPREPGGRAPAGRTRAGPASRARAGTKRATEALSRTGLVFGIAPSVVMPPATAARAPVAMVSLPSSP